jgi:RHS repeat-associated protein
MAGISDKAVKAQYAQNKFRYGGKELQNQEFSDGIGLELYDFSSRLQDPQLGVWHNLDILADYAPNFSPYVYCYNNPYEYIDPSGMEGEDGDSQGGSDDQQRYKYLYNTKTGEVTSEKVSEGEYQQNTQGGTTNLVSGDPGGGGQLMFDYERKDGGTGAFETSTYRGTNTDDVGARDDNYTYTGANFKGGSEENKALEVAGTINDWGVGAVGAFGNGTMSRNFVMGVAMNSEVDGDLSKTAINVLGKIGSFSKYGEIASKSGPWIGGIIGVAKTVNAYSHEGHIGPKTIQTGVAAAAGVAGGWAGAEGGAALGASIGVWFGGVGAVPGAIIGGFVGGIVGSWGGEKIGEEIAK